MLKKLLIALASSTLVGAAGAEPGVSELLDRTISVAKSDAKVPVFCSADPCPPDSVRPLPTYTRQDLVYGEVTSRLQQVEEDNAELIKQRKSLIKQQNDLIKQQSDLITQQHDLERQKSQLLEQGLGASSAQIQQIQQKVRPLDQRIQVLTNKVAGVSRQVEGVTHKVDAVTKEMTRQRRYIDEATQYLKEQAKAAFSNGEQFLRDFYKIRTEMYPAYAERYQREMESLLQQYRQDNGDQ